MIDENIVKLIEEEGDFIYYNYDDKFYFPNKVVKSATKERLKEGLIVEINNAKFRIVELVKSNRKWYQFWKDKHVVIGTEYMGKRDC